MNTDPVNAQKGMEQPCRSSSASTQESVSSAYQQPGESSPPYTAPYPPFLTDGGPHTGALSVQVASGLAYFTVLPAIFFLILQPYRSNAAIRFHSWQSIFYFVVLAGVRVVEILLVSMLPSEVAFTMSSLLWLALLLGWLMATIKAFQGSRLHLFFIGEYAEQTARTNATAARAGTNGSSVVQ